jgi:hypothetical protein
MVNAWSTHPMSTSRLQTRNVPSRLPSMPVEGRGVRSCRGYFEGMKVCGRRSCLRWGRSCFTPPPSHPKPLRSSLTGGTRACDYGVRCVDDDGTRDLEAWAACTLPYCFCIISCATSCATSCVPSCISCALCITCALRIYYLSTYLMPLETWIHCHVLVFASRGHLIFISSRGHLHLISIEGTPHLHLNHPQSACVIQPWGTSSRCP